MHSRRKFEVALDGGDVRAAIAMNLYKQIYAVERGCKDEGLDADARKARRLEQTEPLLRELKAWAEELHPKLTPSSTLRKGTTYLTGNWEVLTRFLEDGRLEIDNGIVERELRRVAISRKNWLFAGSTRGPSAPPSPSPSSRRAECKVSSPPATLPTCFGSSARGGP